MSLNTIYSYELLASARLSKSEERPLSATKIYLIPEGCLHALRLTMTCRKGATWHDSTCYTSTSRGMTTENLLHIWETSDANLGPSRPILIEILHTEYVQTSSGILRQNKPGLENKMQDNPITGLDRRWGLQEAEAPRFQDNLHMKVVMSALRTGRFYPPGNIPGTHLCYRLSQSQGHSEAGRIASMKNSNDTIGNRTRDLQTTTVLNRISFAVHKQNNILHQGCRNPGAWSPGPLNFVR